jgi:hypothetical protein
MKAPSTNIQAPEKFQAPSSDRSLLVWNLNLDVSLDVETWNLEL